MRNTAGQRAASDYLRDLLLMPGSYRQAWERYATRSRRDTIHQLAVAEVVAGHLRGAPRKPSDAAVTARQVKDTVSRALTGRLSRPSLALLIDAFGISGDESRMLWRLWNGRSPAALAGSPEREADAATGNLGDQALCLHGHVRVVADGRIVDAAIGALRHHTLSLHDEVWVGPDGRIARAHIMQVIEATTPGVDRIALLCATSVLAVELGQGCKELTGPLRQVDTGLRATEILLTRTLDPGDTLTLDYWLTYRWPGNDGTPEEATGPSEVES
jgi:hypothetical protein